MLENEFLRSPHAAPGHGKFSEHRSSEGIARADFSLSSTTVIAEHRLIYQPAADR
jgi:hypothetical protein